MGELAIPTPADRANVRRLCAAWLSSIASDSSPPSLAEYGGLEGFATAVCGEVEAAHAALADAIPRLASLMNECCHLRQERDALLAERRAHREMRKESP